MKHASSSTIVLSLAVAVGATLIYLRDPAWLIDVSSGFGHWQQDGNTRFRWTKGRASFFVPAETKLVRVPLRARFRTTSEPPVLVRIDVDDAAASLVALGDERWTEAVVRMEPSRRRPRHVVRLDLHVDRTWGDRGLGVQVGVVTVE